MTPHAHNRTVIFRCRWHLLVCATLAVLSVSRGEDEMHDLPRFVQSQEAEAELKLILNCSLEGVFTDNQCTIYLRPRRSDLDLGSMEMTSTNADGSGVGYGIQMQVDPRVTGVEVKVGVYWTSKRARGTSEITVLAPYLEPKEGRDAGFAYSFRWERIERKAAQPGATDNPDDAQRLREDH